jgi:hypothetical protein
MKRSTISLVVGLACCVTDNEPSNLSACPLLIELFRNFPCIRIDLGDHVECRVNLEDTSNVCLESCQQ